MGHATEIATLDVYNDNEKIILSGVEKIEELMVINSFIEDFSIQTVTQ